MRKQTTLGIATLVSAFICLSSLSCRQNGENLPPSITIHEPSPGQEFTAGDTVEISATIQDDKKIEKITVQLVNEDYTPCGPLTEFDVDIDKYILRTSYIIPTSLPYSPKYYILVKAYDSKDSKNKYREIAVKLLPKQYMGLLVVVQRTPNMKAVYHVDTLHQVKWLFDVPGDTGYSAYGEQTGQLAVSGSINGDMFVYDMEDSTLAWSKPCIPDPPHPFFRNIDSHQNIFYTCYEEGFISAYNRFGTKVLQTPAQSTAYPLNVTITESYLVAYWKSRNDAGGSIVRHYIASGQVYDSYPTSKTVKRLLSDNSGNIFAFTSDNGQGEVWKMTASGLFNSFSLQKGSLIDAIYLGQGHFAVAQPGGTNIYSESGLQLILFPEGDSGKLSFDHERNIVYSAHAATITAKNLGSGSTTYHIQLPYHITGVHPWYIY